MSLKNKTIRKSISFLLIIFILAPAFLFSNPQKASAIPVIDITQNAWEAFKAPIQATGAVAESATLGILIKDVAKEIIRQSLMVVARRALQEITKSTINWINTGHFGNPLFVENPKSFFKDIAKYEIRILVDAFGYDPNKYPFGRDFALNVINSYKRKLEGNAAYSLSNVINDPVLLRAYRTDFNVGGWNGFLVNTQYPQNNYIGFNMLATRELGRRLDGTVQNTAQKVKTALDQGMGFLSPQICPSNPDYNNLRNPWSPPPKYTETPFNPPLIRQMPDPRGPIETGYDGEDGSSTPTYTERPMIDDPASVAARKQWIENWELENQAKKDVYNKKNACPGGLASTTPGTVVAAQITNAMGSSFRTTELAAAMGNSISAITDALINKFLSKGLNALATKVTPKPEPDTWDYYGNTLGSSPSDPRSAWNVGPDEEIILSVAKKTVEDGIKNTTTEIQLISEIEQLIAKIWPKTRELDICIPGPNLGWEDRLQNEYIRNSTKLFGKTNDSDGNKAAQATSAVRELEFAVNFFKDWINNKMMTELPSSVIYMGAVDELEDLHQQSKTLTAKKRARTQALARLNSIKKSLDNMKAQPAPGSGQEKILIELHKQYKAVQAEISNTSSISDSQNDLDILKEKMVRLTELHTQCQAERTANSWSNPGGKNSRFTGEAGTSCTENSNITVIKPLPATMNTATEYALTLRVTNTGESYWYHGDVFQFVKKSGNIDIHPLLGELPYPVSANRSDPAERYIDFIIPITTPARPGNYSLEAQLVHRKGNPYIRLLDDSTNPRGTDICLNSKKTSTTDVYFGDIININISVLNNGNNEVRNLSTVTTPDPLGDGGGVSPSQSGTEQGLFCDAPIKGGYDHEAFRHANDGSVNTGAGQILGGGIGAAIQGALGRGATGRVTHPEIPLVNANDVLKWARWGLVFGNYTADIKLNCNIIYKSTVLDYKQNLPGLTGIVEPYEAAGIGEDAGGEDGDSGGEGGGSGTCNGPGSPDYAGDLLSAMDVINQQNPGGVASALNTGANSLAYLNAVASELQSQEFNATTGVKNGNDNPNQGDLIAIWRNGDAGMERYDAVIESGLGNRPLNQVGQAEYSGDIPLSCTN